jgi:hypothetical protein
MAGSRRAVVVDPLAPLISVVGRNFIFGTPRFSIQIADRPKIARQASDFTF